MTAGANPKVKELYEFGPFRVDPEKETLLRAGESIPLTPKTFQILLVLVRHSNEVVTKEDLMKTVWPQQAAQPERAGQWEAGAAVQEAFFGNASEARQRAMAALALSRDREVEYGAAFALALAKDSSRSETLADDLAKRFPEDTSVRFSYLPALRAMLALNHGDHAKASDLLQAAVPYELGAQRALFGLLYPVYVRGEAYLADNKSAEAAAEFQKILHHRGIVVSDPVGALARLQLGRAIAMSGDKTQAKTAYQDFLTLWKDADPDIPVLKQAKAEYARLQ